MPRSRILGIYALLGVVALGAGMLVANFFRTSSTLPSGATATPTAVAQAAASATEARPPASTPSMAGVPTAPPSTVLPTAPPVAPSAPTSAPTAPPAATSDPGYIEYVVQRGDILKNIALRYNVTVESILLLNQIPNPDSLVVASVIRIPKH